MDCSMAEVDLKIEKVDLLREELTDILVDKFESECRDGRIAKSPTEDPHYTQRCKRGLGMLDRATEISGELAVLEKELEAMRSKYPDRREQIDQYLDHEPASHTSKMLKIKSEKCSDCYKMRYKDSCS